MAINRHKPLLERDFLRAEFHYEFDDYKNSGEDARLLERLENWKARELKRETQAEASFVRRFFVETWGYTEDGEGGGRFSVHPKFRIRGAGQTGNTGEADLALGWFGAGQSNVPQVVCEFKDIKSALDAKQNRKGNTRSPVMQARDYLWNARRGMFDKEAVQPRFAIVTDMDEFRLYWWEDFTDRYLSFAISEPDQGNFFAPPSLLRGGEEALFDRFLFWFLFRPAMLLTEAGRPRLERSIAKQGKAARQLEGDFYKHYKAYRELLINNIVPQRPEGMTKGRAVWLAQKLLDRLIFVMFAEDMGHRVGFPPQELREQLERFSTDKLLRTNGREVWDRLKLIFSIMDEGGDLGETAIHNFNGGLFAHDPDLDALALENRLFVRFGQTQNQARLEEHKETLLYLAATYNFASEGDAHNSIGLYTLGHIFEQSIVELEKIEADYEGRPSLTEITKRKRDGVYYTPERAVTRIIEETIDPLFARWKADAGWPEDGEPDRAAAAGYWERLQRIKIIDPACGSGAFLIVALRHLRREFEAAMEAALRGGALPSRLSTSAITRQLLARNLFGVDINPASVEITKLSLWLHTAEAKEPLSSLDGTIRCGNSLIDRKFHDRRDLADEEDRDRINTFDWEGDFALGSFDAVIGNPPYVKLQNFIKVHPDMADWLVAGASREGKYGSTQTGNFDLYLPFIEKGLALLNAEGRMGYIAPNLWPTLEYGEGLRRLIHEGRHLEKWLDFRSHQVFEEATVYTAIQIFSKAPVEAIRLAFAGDGDISRVDWNDPANVLPYAAIAQPGEPWLIAPAPVRHLIERLARETTRLDDAKNTSAIFQGIITSADHIFHLRKIARGKYAYTPRPQGGKKQAEVVVALEDALMKPLVSGREAKRFIEPATDTFLLFPYHVDGDGARLYTPEEMAERFPKAWKYLGQFRDELERREGGKFRDAAWYRMGRNQNLDKQETVKLLVPRLVARLQCFADNGGRFYCDNVDVGGVVPRRAEDVWWLSGLLNSPVHNHIFAWISKPFRGDYKSANKQFISPLPIPEPDRKERAGFAALAKLMQEHFTDRVRLRADLAERLGATARRTLPLEDLLPEVRSVREIEEAAPHSLPRAELKKWADEQRKGDEEAAYARLDASLAPGSVLAVTLERGKLALAIDEAEAVRLFVSPGQEELIAAQWRAFALAFVSTGKNDGKRLIDGLRKVVTDAPEALRDQILAIGRQLVSLGRVIADDERQLHDLTATLFGLTPEEEAMVLRGRS